MAYQNVKLPTSTSIRLVELNHSDKLDLHEKRFTLRVVDLETDHPEYEALSYTCGEPCDSLEIELSPEFAAIENQALASIWVNGSEMELLPNLSHALDRLLR